MYQASYSHHGLEKAALRVPSINTTHALPSELRQGYLIQEGLDTHLRALQIYALGLRPLIRPQMRYENIYLCR